jgi:hypothetical protein
MRIALIQLSRVTVTSVAMIIFSEHAKNCHNHAPRSENELPREIAH